MMFMHFDILYVGCNNEVWDELQIIAEEKALTILNIRKTSDIQLINDDISFTFVLTELHLSYNYEGFSIDKMGLKYSFLAILTDEITNNTISVSDCLFKGSKKLLVQKKPNIIYSVFKNNPVSFYLPVEA